VDIAIRAVVLYLAMVVLLRVIGRRELSQLEPFDLILLIVLGDSVQQGLTQDDYSVTGALIAISTIGGLQVLTSWIGFHSPRLARVIEGDPIVVVHDGRVIERNLRRERLTRAELAEAGRRQQIGSIDDVEWAVLEPSGQISFIPRGNARSKGP
jgi:uncharacterized membrane protein YcaP (DUF421 family)